MAVARYVPPEPVSQAVRGRARRPREEELLVWPDLVFVEFISAVLFTISLTVLAVLVNAVLLDQANPNLTPNPSKAPWYFLNLQELLLHMHPALAGVIVPTIALILLGAIPYYDRFPDGQGEWFGTARAKTITVITALVSPVITLSLILFDAGKHVQIYEGLDLSQWRIFRHAADGHSFFYFPFVSEHALRHWPTQLNWLRSVRSIQTEIDWPVALTKIPLGSKVLRTDLLGLPAIPLNVNFPAMIVEQIIPVSLMVGLPLALCAVEWRLGLCKTKRDFMILSFSGFIAVYVTLTVVGTFFRGPGQLLVPYSIFVEQG
jgi:hypothetical protein